MKKYILLALAGLLSACGGGAPSVEANLHEPAEKIRTCESIRGEVLLLTADKPVSIVKIYEPKTIKNEPKKVSCSGQALLSNTHRDQVYYRAFQDSDGDWMIEYNEKPLEK